MKRLIITVITIFAGLQCISATTWYVNKGGSDSNSGKSEPAALLTIQKAIDKAVAGDTILVDKGTYSYIVVPENREPLTIRAVGSASECVIKGDSSKYKRCATLGTVATTNIVLEGFTLTGGWVNEYCEDRRGAGVAYGTANNCIITGNRSGSLSTAAGAYGCTLNHCTISNNLAGDWTGGLENCVAFDCQIVGNESTHVGSGGASGCVLTECTIKGNKTSSSGGGGGCGGCTLYRCRVEGNSGGWASEVNGGSLYDCLIVATGGSRIMCGATCYNCTIVSGKSSHNIWRDTRLYNCLLSGRGGGLKVDGDSNWRVDMYNCFLDTVTVGTDTSRSGCITGDPKFKGSDDYGLQASSPCIDKGKNSYVSTSIDFPGSPRIDNGIVDIGAFEFQTSKASVKSVVACPRYPWNGKVDLKFTIDGTSGTKYDTSFTAKDVAGGTNLTMKTLYKSDGTAANVSKESLLPGTYNWVWDATADLGEGTVLERVVISISVQ